MFASAIAELNKRHLCSLVDTAKMHIQGAKQRQARNANEHRRPSPVYKLGDQVWLHTKHLTVSTVTSRKLFYCGFYCAHGVCTMFSMYHCSSHM